MTLISALAAHPRNYNRHSAAQVADLARSLTRFGQRKPVVVWRGVILAGHGLVEAARSLGWSEIWTAEAPVEWTEAEALAFVAADNELARAADPDVDALAALVAELGDVDEELARLAAGGEEALKRLLASIAQPAGEDPGAQIDKAEELRVKWGVETGQLWQLGEHRLICGDCTDAAVVARVMGGEKAGMAFSDPPYNVHVKGKFTGEIANDNLGTHEFMELLKSAFANVRAICSSSWYVCFEVLHFDQVLVAIGDRPDEVICWAKDSASFYSPNVYNRQFEMIMFFKRDGSLLVAKETNLWSFPKSSSFNHRDEQGLRFNQVGSWLTVHPTTKPLLLVERAIQNSSKAGDLVFDGFLGSGTTLIACERLGRRCRAVEISPGYVAVALERWAVMTGQTPRLVDVAAAVHDAPDDDE